MAVSEAVVEKIVEREEEIGRAEKEPVSSMTEAKMADSEREPASGFVKSEGDSVTSETPPEHSNATVEHTTTPNEESKEEVKSSFGKTQ